VCAYIHAYVFTYMHTHIYTCMNAYFRACIHTFSGCRYCAIAKAKLKELRVPFTEVDVTESEQDPSAAGTHAHTHKRTHANACIHMYKSFYFMKELILKLSLHRTAKGIGAARGQNQRAAG
jgi:glutaredoxin